MSDKQMTAVEWLWSQLPSDIYKHFLEEFDQAKEMEQQQIMEAYEAAEKHCGKKILHGDLYYNEIFKSE